SSHTLLFTFSLHDALPIFLSVLLEFLKFPRVVQTPARQRLRRRESTRSWCPVELKRRKSLFHPDPSACRCRCGDTTPPIGRHCALHDADSTVPSAGCLA